MAGRSKPNLWYVGVLVLAFGAIAFDRFVVGAEAGTIDEGSADEILGTDGVASADAGESRPGKPLGERFLLVANHLEPAIQRRLDGFESSEVPIAQSGDPDDEPAEQNGFVDRHRLTAVLNQTGGDLAVVDGRLLHLGDVIESAELVSINPDGVIFQIGDDFIELPIVRPGFDR